MRVAIVALGCLSLLSACTSTNKCKSGTVLVNATFDATARAADELDIIVELGGAASMTTKLPGPGGRDSGTLQIEFPHGYTAGQTLQISVSARVGGDEVASGSSSTTLSDGCSAIALAVNAGGGGDGGADLTMADMLVLPVPHVTAKPDLVGFSTTLDASTSTDPLGSSLTFAWTVQQVPSGSAITTASLTSKTANKTGFAPDRGGLYKIALTVTTMDGRSATVVTDAAVPTVPLYYFRAAQTDTTSSFGAHVMSSDGTNDHAIGCDSTQDGGISGSLSALPFCGRAWEPPPGSSAPSLYAFIGVSDLASNPTVALYVGSAATNCTTTMPLRVDNHVFNDHFPVTMRFSPDGKRLVYVDAPQDSSMATYRLVTVSVDGSGPTHVVRSDGYFGFTPAIWLDNSTIAWLERDSNSANPITIFKAPDENAAGDPGANTKRTTVLRCDQSANSAHLAEINQFEVSAFGMIVAGNTSPRCSLCGLPEAAVSLYKLADGDCSTTNAKTLAAEAVGGLSWDFALSPDGLTVLFSSTSNQAIPDGGLPEPQTDIFLVPADGTSGAQKIVGDPLYDDTSPRYVAGGRQFIWTQAPRHLDMGADTPAIMIANADGTHVRTFTSSTATGETVVAAEIGSNRGYDCSWVPGGATASATTAILAAVALLLLAMRPRRRD